MKKALLAVAALAALYQFPAHAISESYRQQLENSGCTQVTENQGCNLNMSREWNARHGFGEQREDHHWGRHNDDEHGWKRHADPRQHHHRREEKRREIEAFLRDSVIGQDVSDARQALFGYNCERLGMDHWMKDDFEIRLTSLGGRVRSGRIVN
ncbi:TPA: hypothetical protein ACGQ50_000798 [Enterobacter cloacae]